jgi:DNA-binding NtrC family response regulator
LSIAYKKEFKDMVETKTDFESIPTGTEKVLVVDDEERSVSIMKVVLERLGYNVTAMTSSLKAMELFKEDPHRHDLLLTDLIMPQLTGDKLVSEIIKIRPDMPVIITSGFTDTIVNDNFKQISNKAFIAKPFQPQELAKLVRQVLDRNVSSKPDL